MPLYEFQCNDCGKVFEILVRNARDNRAECPHCGSPARRIISPCSVNFEKWWPEKRALIADALGDDVPPERIPKRPLREV
jgi:putative FmdB family regulatory protein